MLGRILSIWLVTMLCLTLPTYAEETTSSQQSYFPATAIVEPTEWVYVMRDGDSTTYLAMDTTYRESTADGMVLYGDVKKVYTKAGLLQIYHSLKANAFEDADSLALLKQISYSIAHLSYCNQGTSLAYRLHQITFYNRSDNPLQVLDFDDIARQTDTAVTWQPISAQMNEQRAIFYRLTNG